MQSHQGLLIRAACRTSALVVLLVNSVLFIPACSHSGRVKPGSTTSDSPVTAAVVKVTRRNLSNDLRIASEFLPYQEIDVHAKVSGYVKKLYIDWGTHVKQGQLMAVLEVPELAATVSRDQAACQRSMQNVARAQEELARAESAYRVAHLTYTRYLGVQKTRPDLIAQEEVDVAQGKDLETAAAVSAAKDALAAAQQELAVNQSTMQRDKSLFAYSYITAPFTGVVTNLYAFTGSLLPAGTSTSKTALPLCHLSQNDLLRLVIPVPEAVVPSVHVGETVNVQVVPLNRTFKGKVSLISDQIDLQTRTMHTEVEVPNPKYVLIPGMYAYVELPVKSAMNVLSLPIQAVENVQPEEGIVLEVNSGNRVEQRKVRLGIETATDEEIVSGLQEGERVIFGDLTRYHPGELVTPKPVDLASLGMNESGANE